MAASGRKYAMLIGDGMADRPVKELGNKTPLEYAATPAMDSVAASGKVGLIQTIPPGFPPGSDIGNLSLMGYDPAKYFTGRAPIEAAAMGITLKSDQVAFRCNLVTLEAGRMKDYSGGHFEPAETKVLINDLKKALDSSEIFFHVGVDYRHLLVISGIDVSDLHTTPPHDISGKLWQEHLPMGKAAKKVVDIMEKARPVLAACSINSKRLSSGKTPATDIWLWGQGKSIIFPTIQERYSLQGSVISAVDLVKGLGKLSGLIPVSVKGATGYLDTNYKGKVDAGIAALKTQDFIFLHVEAPDETSHEGSIEKKIKAIEDFDKNIVAEFVKARSDFPSLRIGVMPDHYTTLAVKTHTGEPVPFAVCGDGITAGTEKAYCEATGAKGKTFSGESFFNEFINGDFSK
jgi:2,3-bisphosphoglycerate-independent phosphoglycerate mutase